jgi:hypothetical protein
MEDRMNGEEAGRLPTQPPSWKTFVVQTMSHVAQRNEISEPSFKLRFKRCPQRSQGVLRKRRISIANPTAQNTKPTQK